MPKRSHSACRAVVEACESRRLMASIAVTTLADSGPGSLRAALAAAAPGDTVDASQLSGVITLSSQLAVTQNVTISGPGSTALSIDGNGHSTRAFAIDAGLTVSIAGLTITDAGTPGDTGGGIAVAGGAAGQLTLDHVVISDSVATGRGGAISAPDTALVLFDSTVTGNTVTADASGNAFGGGVSVVDGVLTATNSTFDHNHAASTTFGGLPASNDAEGGGAFVGGTSIGETALTNCTFAANTTMAVGSNDDVAFGGGLDFVAGGVGLSLVHTTFAGNTAAAPAGQARGAGVAIDTPQSAVLADNIVAANTVSGSTTAAPDLQLDAALGVTATYNLIGDGTDSGLTDGVNHNLVGDTADPIDAKLAALADNTGPVQTMALLAASPALDAGISVSGVLTDARGHSYSATPDLGAYESVPAGPLTVIAGTLSITGTAEADTISVYYPAHRDGLVRVMFDGRQYNLDATTIAAVSIEGGDGDDVIRTGLSVDLYAYGGAGNDTIVGGDGNDTLSGGAGDDAIYGGNGDDSLRGNGGRDSLFGNDGNDRLCGGTGSNLLNGGAGADVLTGEGGVDTFHAQDGSRDHVFADGEPTNRAYLDAGDIFTGTAIQMI